jgi:hypothetical protein
MKLLNQKKVRAAHVTETAANFLKASELGSGLVRGRLFFAAGEGTNSLCRRQFQSARRNKGETYTSGELDSTTLVLRFLGIFGLDDSP